MIPFLDLKNINAQYRAKLIEAIYKSNVGYTPSEIVATIKASNLYIGISKVSELKEWLISHRGNQTIKYKQNMIELIGSSSIFGMSK